MSSNDVAGAEHVTRGLELKQQGRHEDSFREFSAAAALGNARALNALGAAHWSGEGVEQNRTIAFQHYSRAAAAGDGRACLNLAICYDHGEGVEQNKALAVTYYTRAAEEKGIPEAMYCLGACLEEDDPVAAFSWFKRAADAGHVASMVFVASCYENGEFVKPNKSVALQYCLRAAEAGHVGAMFDLATHFEHDAPDPVVSAAWYRRAAEAGHPDAMFQFARCLDHGRGVAKDSALAQDWLRRATEASN